MAKTMTPVRCKKDGQIEWARTEELFMRQKTGFRPWTFCGFCSAHLVFPAVCECMVDLFLLPGEACATCGRAYDSRIDDYKETA